MFMRFQAYMRYMSQLRVPWHLEYIRPENKNMLLPLRTKICFQSVRVCLTLLRN